MRIRFLRETLMAVTVLSTAPANGAEIVLEQSAVQKLVVESLFKDSGRYYIQRGACSAYLDSPAVTLTGGRVVIRSRLNARLGMPRPGEWLRNECTTCILMSCMARSRLLLPEAFAPKTPAAGSTRMGRPSARHGTRCGTPSSASGVASRESSTGPRNERTFSARNASSIEASTSGLSSIMSQIIAEKPQSSNLDSSPGQSDHLVNARTAPRGGPTFPCRAPDRVTA